MCWTSLGDDLSISNSWMTILLDNMHLQKNSGYSSIMSQRFLFHAIRTGEYTFEQFKNDLLARANVCM